MTYSFKLARRLALNGIALAAGLGAIACSNDLPSDPGSADDPSLSIAASTPLGTRVKTTGNTNILDTPSGSGTVIGTQPKAAVGTLIGGPVKDSLGDNHVRWQVDFDSGVDGWLDKGRLTYSSTPAPNPTGTVASVSVTPSTYTVASHGTVQLAAAAKDAGGNTLSGQTFTWSSSNPTAVSVSSTGLVTDLQDTAPVTITATAGGQSGSAVITITASAPPPSGSLCAPTGSGVCRYVDPNGNDGNPGTSSAPYRTLQQAANVVNPGDVVVVRNGTYTGGSTIVDISRSGTASNPIVFKAENKWGAIINGQNNSSATGVEIRSYYIRVEGFEIYGTNHYGIEAYGGGNVTVAQNHVHDVGHYCTSTSNGIVGINAYVPNMLIEQNVVHDIGRWANGENGCSTSNNYWQNHDHGVYQGEGDNLIIRNNVFYNFTRGWAIQRYDGAGTVVSNLQIVNNTFAGGNPNKDGQIIIATGVNGLVITNNIFYSPTTAGVWLDTGSLSGTIANNLTYGGSVTTGSTSGLTLAGNLTGDPQFTSVGSHNFQLQSGSPAIDRGLSLSIVLNDFMGTLRPRGAGFDIGAYEY
jgi:hypothetical protein